MIPPVREAGGDRYGRSSTMSRWPAGDSSSASPPKGGLPTAFRVAAGHRDRAEHLVLGPVRLPEGRIVTTAWAFVRHGRPRHLQRRDAGAGATTRPRHRPDRGSFARRAGAGLPIGKPPVHPNGRARLRRRRIPGSWPDIRVRPVGHGESSDIALATSRPLRGMPTGRVRTARASFSPASRRAIPTERSDRLSCFRPPSEPPSRVGGGPCGRGAPRWRSRACGSRPAGATAAACGPCLGIPATWCRNEESRSRP